MLRKAGISRTEGASVRRSDKQRHNCPQRRQNRFTTGTYRPLLKHGC